eukprot:8402425-Pyramimonas_sp.AAC.1
MGPARAWWPKLEHGGPPSTAVETGLLGPNLARPRQLVLHAPAQGLVRLSEGLHVAAPVDLRSHGAVISMPL